MTPSDFSPEAELKATEPTPCSQEQFLNAQRLHNTGWHSAGNGESFKLARTDPKQPNARIFARTGNRYWSFTDSAALNHAGIMLKIRHVIDQERADMLA